MSVNPASRPTQDARRLVLAVAIGAAAVLVSSCTGNAPSDTRPTGTSTNSTSSTQAPPLVAFALTPADQAANVAPSEPVTVSATTGKITEVKLTNPEGKPVSGQLSPDGTGWTSTEPLGYAKTYTLTATGQGAGGKTATQKSTFTTVKPARQAFLSMSQLDGQVIGVGQPLQFIFDVAPGDKAVAERAIQINTEPKAEGAFNWFSDKEVRWRPREYWKPGTKVTVEAKIYGRDLGNGVYGKGDRKMAFTIGDAVIARADGQSHQMTVEVNGQVVRTIPVSMGKRGHETPNGTYVVMSEQRNYVMDSSTYGVSADAPGGYRTKVDYASRLSNSGIFYHSAPWSVRDQGHRNVSHGCLNVSTQNAAWLQGISKRGDIVIVTNSGGAKLQPWDGFADWQVPWEEWVKGSKK